MNSYYVYILANRERGTFYVGVTGDLARRVFEHNNYVVEGFTKKYLVDQLVYFEETPSASVAIMREKQLKNWRRDWKISLIETQNPKWLDLSLLVGAESSSA
jgi:putative endonuclease